MVSSPAHPRPRLARVTPTWVTESRRPGLESRLSAACAPALPSAAICRSREWRTESSDTSAPAKKPLMTISSTTSSRRMDGSFTGSEIILAKTLTKRPPKPLPGTRQHLAHPDHHQRPHADNQPDRGDPGPR